MKSSVGDVDDAATGRLAVGVPASPGFVVAPAFLLDRRRIKIPKKHIQPNEVEIECERLAVAIRQVDQKLEHARARLLLGEDPDNHTGIIDAYCMMLHDEYLLQPTYKRIREELYNAEWAWSKTIDEIKHRFDEAGVDYIRERRSDVGFIGDQLLQGLMGNETPKESLPTEGSVLVAHEVTPVDVVHWHGRIRGIITATGGRTSHMVIVARSFSLPVVVGVGDWIEQVGQGDLVMVDGHTGTVCLHPDDQTIARGQASFLRPVVDEASVLSEGTAPPSHTAGLTIDLLANVELPEEIPLVLKAGAQGIGLYRTEYLFLDRQDPPTEDEHYLYAKDAMERTATLQRAVTFRTMDLGSDKFPPFLKRNRLRAGVFREPNPALGMRSLRLCLQEPALFKAQIRGFLRAVADGNRCRILFPMVSGLSDWRQAYDIFMECKKELGMLEWPQPIPVGAMIEMPSAVMVADQLAKEADFFSIGTNDLIQYSLAVDRSNELVESLYQPLHPAILRMIYHVVQAAKPHACPVDLCGEMAGNPLYTPLLIGLGLDGLSMNVSTLPAVRASAVKTDRVRAVQLATQVMEMEDALSIRDHVKQFL